MTYGLFTNSSGTRLLFSSKKGYSDNERLLRASFPVSFLSLPFSRDIAAWMFWKTHRIIPLQPPLIGIYSRSWTRSSLQSYIFHRFELSYPWLSHRKGVPNPIYVLFLEGSIAMTCKNGETVWFQCIGSFCIDHTVRLHSRFCKTTAIVWYIMWIPIPLLRA